MSSSDVSHSGSTQGTPSDHSGSVTYDASYLNSDCVVPFSSSPATSSPPCIDTPQDIGLSTGILVPHRLLPPDGQEHFLPDSNNPGSGHLSPTVLSHSKAQSAANTEETKITCLNPQDLIQKGAYSEVQRYPRGAEHSLNSNLEFQSAQIAFATELDELLRGVIQQQEELPSSSPPVVSPADDTLMQDVSPLDSADFPASQTSTSSDSSARVLNCLTSDSGRDSMSGSSFSGTGTEERSYNEPSTARASQAADICFGFAGPGAFQSETKQPLAPRLSRTSKPSCHSSRPSFRTPSFPTPSNEVPSAPKKGLRHIHLSAEGSVSWSSKRPLSEVDQNVAYMCQNESIGQDTGAYKQIVAPKRTDSSSHQEFKRRKISHLRGIRSQSIEGEATENHVADSSTTKRFYAARPASLRKAASLRSEASPLQYPKDKVLVFVSSCS